MELQFVKAILNMTRQSLNLIIQQYPIIQLILDFYRSNTYGARHAIIIRRTAATFLEEESIIFQNH